ncbi:Hypothetical predicted protein [Mytilus galloprovincialis]|uniref:Reverse transcriptase domain-containing protein n=1 Tax=Mytilus galloprovincialis TaxID=29158 RepID=A0A8B6CG62_MYTGA|nr:Hypothetical predicted protein [Mytilus galloprovincialis]
MGINNRRSMGTENFTRGFEIRISRNSSLDRYKTHTSVNARNLPIILAEVEDLIEKNAIEIVPQAEIHQGFYSTLFLVPKKTGDLRPVINLKPLNQYLRKQHFKMDTLTKVLNLVKPQDWALSLDLKDAYLHIPVHKNTQKISTFLHTRQMLPICSSVFRSFSSTSSVHKNSYCSSSSSSENPKHTPSNLFGRLVASECSRENANFRQRENTQSSDKFGIYSKSSKIFSYPITRDHLHRGIIQFQEGDSFSNYGKNFKVRNVSDKHNEGTQYGKRLSNVVGFDSVLHRIDPQCTPLYEAYPITSTSFLETIHQRSYLSNSIYSTPKRSFELVVGQSKHYQGQIITPVVSNPHNNNRCFKDRVWGSHEQSDFSRFLVCSRTETTHKSLGIGSCNSNSTTFPTTITKSKCATQMRQHNSRSICKQTGGTKSIHLCYKTWCLMKMAIQNNLTFRAAHIAGKLNVLADHLSRNKIQPTEWTLNNQIVQSVFAMWGEPTIDLFASVHNHKRPVSNNVTEKIEKKQNWGTGKVKHVGDVVPVGSISVI